MRSIAAKRINEAYYIRWFCKKYNYPFKHPVVQDHTVEDILLERLADLIEEDPAEAYPHRNANNVQFITGDAQVDKWEIERAKGVEVDLNEGLDKKGKSILARLKSGNVPSK